MNTTADFSNSPNAEYRYFIYDPEGNGFLYFKTPEDRDIAKDWVIQGYLDDGWNEEVEQVVAGELTHTCEKIDIEHRPDDVELDDEQCDGDGKYWGDFAYTCNYDLVPLAAAPAQSDAPPALICPAAAVEGDELVIRVTLDGLCHGVTMGDGWPVQYNGESGATIVDRPLFYKELINELQRENEQGATPLHFLFDAAALEVIEQGGESIELHEDEGDDE